MRATNDEQRTTSRDLCAVSVGLCVGRRAAASGDLAPDDRRRAAGHALRATACVPRRAAVYGQRATQAASDEPWATRLANPGDLLRSNKPMMLVATNCAEDHRPARGDSISASRWAASDGGGVGGRQELGGWTAAAGGERRQRATSNERRPEEHELGQRATFNEQRSGERRVASDERRVASNGDEQRGGERRTAGNAATRDGGERRGGGLRATSNGQRRAKLRSTRACPTSRWC